MLAVIYYSAIFVERFVSQDQILAIVIDFLHHSGSLDGDFPSKFGVFSLKFVCFLVYLLVSCEL